MSARIGEHDDRTRFVVEVSDPVAMRVVHAIRAQPRGDRHAGGAVAPDGAAAAFGAMACVRSYRYGLFRPGNSRFVIDLNKPVSVSDALVIPPEAGYGYRVVIDLFSGDAGRFRQARRLAGRPEGARDRGRAGRRASAADAGNRSKARDRDRSGPWRHRFGAPAASTA